MKLNEIRKSTGKKPQVAVLRYPQRLVRQRLLGAANLATAKTAEMPNNREGMASRVEMSLQSDLSSDCSNKHLATNQSTTSSIPHSIDDEASVQKNSDNINPAIQ